MQVESCHPEEIRQSPPSFFLFFFFFVLLQCGGERPLRTGGVGGSRCPLARANKQKNSTKKNKKKKQARHGWFSEESEGVKEETPGRQGWEEAASGGSGAGRGKRKDWVCRSRVTVGRHSRLRGRRDFQKDICGARPQERDARRIHCRRLPRDDERKDAPNASRSHS